MPKGKRLPQAGTRLPSLRGVIVVDEYQGKPRTRAWPRPRGQNRSETNQYWTRWLKAVTFMWRYQPQKFQEQLARATRGTPWMPRDPFISAVRGRAWSITDQQGRTYYPLPVRQAVSQSLDAVAQLAGEMLWRGANGWIPIPSGSPGDVLTYQPDPDPPAWAPGGAGASSGVSLRFDGSIGQGVGASNLIPWDVQVFDDDGYWDAGSPTLITIPAGAGGRYLVTAQIRWSSTILTSFSTLIEDASGPTVLQGAMSQRGTSVDRVVNPITAILELTAGQQLQLRARRGAGAGTATISSDSDYQTTFQLQRL